jgi:hypothetical protein
MDVRRELGLINKHVRRRNRAAGEHTIWYQFKPLNNGASLYDDVYDEGVPGAGGRSYTRGIVIPVIYATEAEDEYRAIPEARQPTQTLQLIILHDDAVNAGLDNAGEYNDHLNDIVEYDSRYYKISSYRVRGRLNGEAFEVPRGEVVIQVNAYEVFVDQEFPFSVGPVNPSITSLPWPTSFPS